MPRFQAFVGWRHWARCCGIFPLLHGFPLGFAVRGLIWEAVVCDGRLLGLEGCFLSLCFGEGLLGLAGVGLG